jgi:hypothetical protein
MGPCCTVSVLMETMSSLRDYIEYEGRRSQEPLSEFEVSHRNNAGPFGVTLSQQTCEVMQGNTHRHVWALAYLEGDSLVDVNTTPASGTVRTGSFIWSHRLAKG